ncbi:MAG TPA: periplasmic heavy metal sensor [Pyrinomonadaceae bacterium]|nr:periplasmic heavy metal sensor [Pyrinomonadaceae bacterium]
MKRIGKIQTLAIAALSAVAVSVPVALAQDAGAGQQEKRQEWRGEGRGSRRGGRHGGHFGGGLFRGVDLTEEQQARVKQIHQSYGERIKPIREQLHAKRQELRQASEGTTFNEALATQKLTESASLEARLMGEQFRLRQELLAVLTPEQRAQLEARREQFKARRGARRGVEQQQQQ